LGAAALHRGHLGGDDQPTLTPSTEELDKAGDAGDCQARADNEQRYRDLGVHIGLQTLG
jgi:hypothetical protein